MTAPMERKLFTADEFELMTRAGVFGEDDPLELLEGEIIKMAPIGSRHAACVNRLNKLLNAHFGPKVIVSIQSPLRLGELSEPQPDVAVLRPRDDFYAAGHPGPEDVLLVVEVAETSADYDREVKLPLYAAARIPELWLIDLGQEEIEVFSEPLVKTYSRHTTASRGQTVVCRSIPDLCLPADAVLGR